ncbi:MAG TPA: hypothetical protein VFP49_12835 [Nitrososphaeraceae archaeon]|nr:hypothetical protein [Nitrososphaeraceae archaeon]
MSKLEEAMLKHIQYIVNIEYRPFSFKDLLDFQVDGQTYNPKRGTIRNKLSKFSKEGKIELCYKDVLAFYSLPGKKFGKEKLMTDNNKDIIQYHNNKHELYKSIRKHPVYNMIKDIIFGKTMLHDIQLSFHSKGLWKYLSSIDYYRKKTNTKKAIAFGYYPIERYLSIQVMVQHTDTVNVIVGCSNNSIVCDFDGIMRLSEALTRIEERLAAVVNDPNNKTFNAEYNPSNIKISNKDDWIITLWHLHRDSYEEYSGEKFQCSWKIAKNLFIHIYSKELRLNRNIIRVELQENPHFLFKNLLVEFIRNDNYQRLIELLV